MKDDRNIKKRKRNPFATICTVLITLLIVAIFWVCSLAWSTLGKKTLEVAYTAGEEDFVGSVPATRKFEPGEEVVVRAAELSKAGMEFAGWKDANEIIDSASDILQNGTVFIMPANDVLLEAVWEEESSKDKDKKEDKKDDTSKDDDEDSDTSSTISEEDAEVYYINAGKDYVNIRSNHGYDSKIIAKISDSDMKILYAGKTEEVYDEDEGKSFDWYLVSIPSKDIEGWIRSDLLTEADDQKDTKKEETDDKTNDTSKTDGNRYDGEDSKGQKYTKSNKYDVALIHKEPDSHSEVIEKIEDVKTVLYFNNQSKEITDDYGEKKTWYYVSNGSNGKSGWVDSKRLVKSK